MATTIFLGEPPAKIKQWIIDHYGSKFPNMETLPLMASSELNLNEDTTLIIDENENILGNMLYKDLIDNIIS